MYAEVPDPTEAEQAHDFWPMHNARLLQSFLSETENSCKGGWDSLEELMQLEIMEDQKTCKPATLKDIYLARCGKPTGVVKQLNADSQVVDHAAERKGKSMKECAMTPRQQIEAIIAKVTTELGKTGVINSVKLDKETKENKLKHK